MDYPDASHHWFHDALDVVYSPRIDGRCLYPRSTVSPFPLELIVLNTGNRTCI